MKQKKAFVIFFSAIITIPSIATAAGNVSQGTFNALHPFTNRKTEITVEPLTKKPIDVPGVVKDTPTKAKSITSNHQIFGHRGGYFHSSLGIDFEYTDNLYNVDENKQDNWLTEIAPSVWLTVPRRSRVPLHVAPHNTSVGGMQFSQPENYFFNKYQLYLGAGLDFKDYSENSSLNATDGKLEGLLQYNLTQNLTLALMDRFTRSQDMFNLTNATSNNQRIYDSNIVTVGADWQISEKFSTRLDYNHFELNYDDEVNRFFDRADNGFDFYFFYDYSLKTNFFIQYRYLVADYDKNDDRGFIYDNDNTFIYGGINWKPTVKTTFMAKAGYQNVDYDNPVLTDSPNIFSFEIQANWKATVKTSLLLDATYNVEQTDSYGALNKKVFSGRLGYQQRFSNRFRGMLNIIYENSDYNQFDGTPREDDRFYFKPELQYAFRRWLTGELSYTFDSKDSSKDYLDYESNIFRFGLKATF